jgi:hypothetical protein
VYRYEFEDIAKAQLVRLPYDAVDDLVEAVALICADPWSFERTPTEPADDHHAHRTVPFAEGRGLLTFLILEHAAEVHVTSITWVG